MNENVITPQNEKEQTNVLSHRNEFDYTMMSTFLNCRRRYNYRVNRGLVRKQEPMPFSFGSAIHKALDTWYVAKNLEDALSTFNKNFEEDLELDTKRTPRS
jgi:hypothetical protein